MPDHAHPDVTEDRPPSSALPFAQQPALQLIYDTAPIGLAFLSPDCRYVHINQRLTEICGLSIEAHLGRTVRECVPGLADSVEAIVRSIIATGEPVIGVEVDGQRSDQDGNRSWITYWHPLRGADGAIVGVNVAAEEITERKRAEAALRAREGQFHTLADAIPQLVWMADAEGRIYWINRRWFEYTGVPVSNGGVHDWQVLLAPDSRREVSEAWAYSLRNGTPLEMELSHRTKNLLAVVMAVARQTAQYTDNVKLYETRFLERLQALSYCHDLLVRDRWHGASLHDLISAQMSPFGGPGSGQINAAGPRIVLRADAVQHLGLALHELATNASKHGALSTPHGEVAIRWQVEEADERIRFSWSENGGPTVVPPQRRGFGRVVIEQIVPRALNGSGHLEFEPSGVNWTFEFNAQD